VGWSIDSTQTTSLVLNALGMATQRRPDRDGLVIHSDRGVQFTSWAVCHNLTQAGISPSMGAVGSAYDNALMESFWGRMQVELLDRRRWKTRIELAAAIHDYIELWHNTRRRHSSLAMRTPVEVEHAWAANNHAMTEAAGAKTAKAGEVHETSPSGLLAPAVEAIPPNHHLLNNSNDQAA
jgi:transposase InsO family protein